MQLINVQKKLKILKIFSVGLCGQATEKGKIFHLDFSS